MTNNALDYFGKLLMTKVRDKAIIQWDKTIEGKMKDSDSQEIYKILSNFNQEQISLISKLIPQIVDTTIHHLLWTLEQVDTVDISVKLDTNFVKRLQEESDGLAGELYTEEGWIKKFSTQRYDSD